MIQRFLLNSKITGIPKVFVSAKVWKIKVTIANEFWWKDKNRNDKDRIWKIYQVLN